MHTVADLRLAAQRRLPRIIFDHIDGGATDEVAVRRNISAFEDIKLVPRVLRRRTRPCLSTEFLGSRYGAPLGAAPMGLADMAWPGTDLALATVLSGAGLPCCLSSAGSTGIEQMAAVAADHLWFQIYLGARTDIFEDLLARAGKAGVKTLVFTVDANFKGRRLRDMRNRMALPLKMTPAVLTQLVQRLPWSIATARAGTPSFGSLNAYSKGSNGIGSLHELIKSLASAHVHWDDLERLRAQWRGKLLVKGVLHPEDALRMKAIGIDAVIVSNHGGRQLSAAVPTIEALPAIRAAVGPDFPLVLDSGVRSGEDVVKALASGANFVLLGRPFLYAAAALGPERGVRTLLDILREDMETTMAQIGCATVAEVSSDHLWSSHWKADVRYTPSQAHVAGPVACGACADARAIEVVS